MPLLAPFVAAALPTIIESIPALGRLFGSGSATSERNVKAAEMVVEIVRNATGATNAQDAAERVKADPAARQAAETAIAAHWMELEDAGGGGIAGARASDAAAMARGGPWWGALNSPSFLFLLLAMPLVWAIVGSVVGLWGAEWPGDVRAAIATAVVSLVIGGGAGYYWGQTTSRNRTPGP